MAASTVQIRTRVNRALKRRSDRVLANLGLDTGAYVTMALAQLINRRGLPFAVTESDEDYFANEYGLTAAEKTKAGERMALELSKAKRAGTLKEIQSVEDLVP